ncbi:hypothetical protein [Pleomorphovibrio marinus]|uniref:hypothetical protein n=1 Tax=Pleomorphovibrio marinus TaxID=2164132 RepID=UPI001300573E|nr:hypothetical protein [Pleomorphovibrio marinus]
MEKKKSDDLIRKLVENRLTRREFEEIISGIMHGEIAPFLESSLRDHFDEALYRYNMETKKNTDPEKEFRK